MTEQPIGDPGSYGGSASLPLDKLIAFALASCRETYPEGRIAELLDVMEREHAAGMERLEEAVRAYQAHIDAQT